MASPSSLQPPYVKDGLKQHANDSRHYYSRRKGLSNKVVSYWDTGRLYFEPSGGSGFVFRSKVCLRKFEERHTETLSWHLLVYCTYTMQLLSLLFVATLAVASPAQSLYARAAATDACNVGYCTQNGGYVLLPHLLPQGPFDN